MAPFLRKVRTASGPLPCRSWRRKGVGNGSWSLSGRRLPTWRWLHWWSPGARRFMHVRANPTWNRRRTRRRPSCSPMPPERCARSPSPTPVKPSPPAPPDPRGPRAPHRDRPRPRESLKRSNLCNSGSVGSDIRSMNPSTITSGPAPRAETSVPAA